MKQNECGAPAVELIGVTKRYRSTTAVDNISLTIPRGSTLGLIGPNGAGKSTAIKILIGMLAPTGGSVRVLGIDVAKDPVQIRRRVGYVPERHDIYPWMTVAEVIGFTRAFYETWDDGLCRELQDQFQLDQRKKVKHLSKGNVVKLGLLLAVSHRPELLILDEPTSGLDPIIHEDFLDGVLRSICQGETTVLFSSHDLGDIRRLADSVCILREGKVLVQRGIDEMLSSAKRVRAVLSDGHLPRWVPQNTVWQQVQRREWLLTIDEFDSGLPRRIQDENPVESVEVFDLSLNDLFRDYILGEGAAAMRQLMWKDYRLYRSLLIFAVAVLFAIHLVAAFSLIRYHWPKMPTAALWADLLASTATLALFLNCGMAALLGGNAIACERGDRTAFFLAYLPPTKGQILASKLLVTLVPLAAMWGCMFLSMYVFARELSGPPFMAAVTWNAKLSSAICVLTFGVGWLCSSMLERPVIPVAIALISPFVVAFLVAWTQYITAAATNADSMQWYATICVCIGLAAFAAGTWYFLRRVEP